MRRGYFGENGIWARLRADFGGAAAGLDGRDAALATQLCFGVLQNKLLDRKSVV